MTGPPGARRPIVVADDEPDIREILTDFLAAHGVDVVQAADGLDLLEQVRRVRPSAVVMDLHMPRLDGLEALRRIRDADPDVRVIVVSGSVEETREHLLAAGAAVVLTKPLQLADLLPALGLAAGAEPAPVTPAAAGAPAAGGPGRGGVLVVDDDEEMREILVEMLTLHGHAAWAVAGAADAAAAVAACGPDVLLLDIHMPGLSGVDALPVLRAMAPDMKVIMVSGTADLQAARHALALGAFDYIVKPVDMVRLTEVVDAALLFRLGPD